MSRRDTAADPQGREWFSPSQLAEWLDVPVKTVYVWNYERTGPPYRYFGRTVRYRRCDVEEWIKSRELIGGEVR